MASDFGMFPSASEFIGQTFGIYPRVSSKKQATEDKASLDAQIDACREYGEAIGMTLDNECVRKEAFTSTTLERPELKALLADMIRRSVRNLVIDRADRLTREGMLAAAKLLTQFTEAGILLHVVSANMVIRDEYGVQMFLQMAFAAQQANSSRIRALVQTRRRYAREGRYLQGNRPPYGFDFHPLATDARGNPTKVQLVQDLREVNGHRPWEVRCRICRDYLAGNSLWRIAERLTAEHVPTSNQLAGFANATPHWSGTTVREILRSPLNEGIVRCFNTTEEWKPADAKHPTRWQQKIPGKDPITLPDGVMAEDAVILTHSEAEALRAKLSRGKRSSPRNSVLALQAMLRGGLAKCCRPSTDDPERPCGGVLRVKTDTRYPTRHSMNYACTTHEKQPHRCGGTHISVEHLDLIVWTEVLRHLLEPGRFEALAREQARLDTQNDPASHLNQLRRTRKDLERKASNLADTIADTDSPVSRATLQQRLDQFTASMGEADEEIAAYVRLSQDFEHRRAVIGNIHYQMKRHIRKVRELDDSKPADILVMHTICRSLGVQATARVLPTGKYDVTVDFNLGSATATPWFPRETPASDTLEQPAEVSTAVSRRSIRFPL